MSTTSAQRHAAPSHRHHPYASAQTQAAGPSKPRGKASPQFPSDPNAPPSPPRSRRDHSETPPIGLGAAFGGAVGGKWWDEELPAPPASLTSILDSFRRSGEGDRDLLLSILGAKKAEEERLTALIQTRLTILQARLSLHSTAASLAQTEAQTASPAAPFPQIPLINTERPTPSPHHASSSLPNVNGNGNGSVPIPRTQTHGNNHHGRRISGDRTPSLESPGSHSAASSPGAISPTSEIPPSPRLNTGTGTGTGGGRKMNKDLDRYTSAATYVPSGGVLPTGNYWRRDLGADKSRERDTLPPIRVDCAHARASGSVSPKSTSPRNGLDMLLDAGRSI